MTQSFAHYTEELERESAHEWAARASIRTAPPNRPQTVPGAQGRTPILVDDCRSTAPPVWPSLTRGPEAVDVDLVALQLVVKGLPRDPQAGDGLPHITGVIGQGVGDQLRLIHVHPLLQ